MHSSIVTNGPEEVATRPTPLKLYTNNTSCWETKCLQEKHYCILLGTGLVETTLLVPDQVKLLADNLRVYIRDTLPHSEKEKAFFEENSPYATILLVLNNF